MLSNVSLWMLFVVQKDSLFAVDLEKKAKTFFCIILKGNFCVKIIPKLEKNTTQLENMCYNIHGKKRAEDSFMRKEIGLPFLCLL